MVSVVVASYHSAATLPRHLASLAAQAWSDFEIIVVDSSPDDASAHAVRASGVPVELVRSPGRLLPQEARNRGAVEARGELLLFTDPDVYLAPDWLERLVASHLEHGHPVIGALDCWGDRWLDRGIHLTKFSKFLPAGPPRPVDTAPTATFLCPRSLFESVGGFPSDPFQGDALLSWRLLDAGVVLWFEPRAVADHHHLSTFGDFLRERFRRGLELGHLRATWSRHRRIDDLWFLIVSLSPVRLTRILFLVARHAVQAGWGLRLLLTLPIVASGHAANLWGESLAYSRRLTSPGTRERAEERPAKTTTTTSGAETPRRKARYNRPR